MYYEEQIIDGVLCYRMTPDGKWAQLSRIELTARLIRFYNELNKIVNYDLEHNDPLADCVLKQMAINVLCKAR